MRVVEVTRRQMLAASAGMALAGLCGPGPGRAAASIRSRVVLIRDPYVMDARGNVREAVIGAMLDRAVARLLDETDPDRAWKKLFRPEDTVGVKSNVWRNLRTPPELERVIVRRVVGAGVPPDRVAVDDRGVLQNPVFLNATALINVRPLRTHAWSGVGSLIKNYIMFVPDPPRYHPDSCARLGAIWKLPLVAGKTRLNILVMLTPLFYGVGRHHYDPAYVWRYCGLLVGRDPVAVDATGLRILMNKRRAHFGEERRMEPPAKHIELADTRYGLGTSDPSQIEVIPLGWAEDLLL
jgi:hypothetical protein